MTTSKPTANQLDEQQAAVDAANAQAALADVADPAEPTEDDLHGQLCRELLRAALAAIRSGPAPTGYVDLPTAHLAIDAYNKLTGGAK